MQDLKTKAVDEVLKAWSAVDRLPKSKGLSDVEMVFETLKTPKPQGKKEIPVAEALFKIAEMGKVKAKCET